MFINECDRDQLRRMRECGIPLGQDDFQKCLTVRQDGYPFVNCLAAHYLSRDHIGLTIKLYIKIVSNCKAPVSLCGFQLYLPWTRIPVQLLPDRADPFAPETCKFPGPTSQRFDKSDIILQSGKLKRGACNEGFLLGFHCDPIPRSYCHGDEVRLVFALENQFQEIYSTELSLTVDRTAEHVPKPETPSSRTSLFAKPYRPKTETQAKGKRVEAATAPYAKPEPIFPSRALSSLHNRFLHELSERVQVSHTL